MKIFLDKNFGITNINYEETTQDSIGYNIIKCYVPSDLVSEYDSFGAYYAAVLPSSRKVGYFALEGQASSDEEDYTLYQASLHTSVVSVAGVVQLGLRFLYGDSGDASLKQKTTPVIQFPVRKSVSVNNDILVLDDDQTTTNVLESYKNLLENALATYVTIASLGTSVTTATLNATNATIDDLVVNNSVSMGRLSGTTVGSKSTTLGTNNTASGTNSVAEGQGTIANGVAQHVGGKYNVADTTSLEIIGNGTSDSNRSNARKLDASGNETLAGDLVYNKSTSLTSKMATKADLNNRNQDITARVYNSIGGYFYIVGTNSTTQYYSDRIYNSTNHLTWLFPSKGGTFALTSEISSLQTQINTLKSVQNVVDTVATYSALTSLATTHLDANDKVQVIADETHGGATTIYNWNGSSWVYVGAYGGNSYTKTQVDNKLDLKADKTDTYTKTQVDNKLDLKADLTNSNQNITAKVYNSIGGYFYIIGPNITTLYYSDKIYNSTNSLTWLFPSKGGTFALTSEIASAKSELQTQITANANEISTLKSVQNVIDVVATYANLSSVTGMETNDKVQVIADETHNGATTIYNWNGSAWQYVGAYGGNSYTKTQTDTLLDGKADKSTTYTKTETDTLLNNKADKSTTYTKTETDTLLNAKASKNGSASEDFTTNNLTVSGNETLAGDLVYNGNTSLTSKMATKADLNNNNQQITAKVFNSINGYFYITGHNTTTQYYSDKIYNSTNKTTWLFPSKGGTFALTSQIASAKSELQTKLATTKTYTDNAINDLHLELGSHILDVESDTTTAYTKTVPSGAIGCQINKIGGMSYKTTNVLNLTDTSGSRNGVTYTVSDGVITLNGTVSAGSFNQVLTLTTSIPKGTYTFLPFGTYTNVSMYIIDNGVTYETNVGSSTSVTITTDSATVNLYFKSAASGYTYNNYTIKPMLVSGSTAPSEYQPYFEGIRDTAVTSVVSKDSNDTTLDTFTIDSHIQELEGYGQSNPDDNTEYNYIDFENKTFVRVGYIDNGVWVSSALTTDISQYIDDNSIEVEPNGTLTFNNTYEQAVPSDIDYLIEEVKA